ncbi:IS110 family RNA-guided transposase [Methylotetracoccus oryzae]|uniref:IS110 family transposase n=1 Tax=Methylotetracoccus oryzae TaxID=1919059 RepID=UPI00111B0EB6|nr:IS110 family transposase [Methylotetracoccus oryzae]
MALYCGIDLHSNNHVVVVIDDEDRRILERRLGNELTLTLQALEPFRSELVGVAVESTFNWYWLVDGLQAAGYPMRLVNTTAVQQYAGLKYTDDRYDAYWLAHLMRLGILPTGYIYPKEQRGIRDLLRRRMQLMQAASTQLISVQSQIWRETGERIATRRLKQADFVVDLPGAAQQLSAQSALLVYRAIHAQQTVLEQVLLQVVGPQPNYQLLTTIPGVGAILGMTIALETGDIRRFPGVGHYASYCRCVRSEKVSNGKKKGEGNAKSGNKYLSWAFAEAAHFAVRYQPLAKRFFDRKQRKTNGIVAIRSVAHKLARAAYYMLRDQVPFDAHQLFA